MKRTLSIFAIIFLIYFSLIGQEIKPVFKQKLTKGIYRTYTDFLNNSPNETIKFNVRTNLGKKGELRDKPFIYLSDKKSSRVINYWGFSDGESAYIFKNGYFFKLDINKNTNEITYAAFPQIVEPTDPILQHKLFLKAHTFLIDYKLNLDNGKSNVQTKNIMEDRFLPKKGLYENYLEFYYNHPTNNTRFYKKEEAYKKGYYKGEKVFRPYTNDANKFLIKNIYGFSDGENFYIYDQLDFFLLEYVNDSFRLQSHPRYVNKNGYYGFGLVGALVDMAADNHDLNKIRKQVSTNTINPNNGQVLNAEERLDEVKLIVYRTVFAQTKENANFYINNTLYSFPKNDWVEFSFPESNGFVDFKFENEPATKIRIPLNFGTKYYIEVSRDNYLNKEFVLNRVNASEAFKTVKIKKRIRDLKEEKKESKRNKKRMKER